MRICYYIGMDNVIHLISEEDVMNRSVVNKLTDRGDDDYCDACGEVAELTEVIDNAGPINLCAECVRVQKEIAKLKITLAGNSGYDLTM